MTAVDPYQVLGVERTWTLDEIEGRYRVLVRQHHPDLHRQEGDEAVAAAEAHTRRLNEAMKRLREHHPENGYAAQTADFAGSRIKDEEWTRGPRGEDFGIRFEWPPAPEEEEEEEQVRREQPCPFCAEVFDDLPLFGLHLIEKHGVDYKVHGWQLKKKRRGGIVRGPQFSNAEKYIEIAALALCVILIPVFLWWRTNVNGFARNILDPFIFTAVGLCAVVGFYLTTRRGK